MRAFNHLLGECGVSIFGTKDLATKYRRRFPKSLDGAPFIIPTGNTALRRALEHWFDSEDIRPLVFGEFEDSALLKVFGQAGVGFFAAPTAIEKEVQRQYSVRVVGRLESVRERYYAISVEKKVKHPAVLAIVDEALQKLSGWLDVESTHDSQHIGCRLRCRLGHRHGPGREATCQQRNV